MARNNGQPTDSVANFNKIIAAAKKATQRNNVVLQEACSTGKLNFIKTSLDNGADVNNINEQNEFPLVKACRIQSQIESERILKYLLKRGANANIQDPFGRTAMSYMAEEGREFHVDMLLSKCDADPGIEDVKGNTPLMYAVSSNSVDIVATLLGYFLAINFPIDKRNIVGNTPLLLAARLGHIECARMLVELGNANIHLRDLDNFRSSVDWLRITVPQCLPEFVKLDPIEQKKDDKRAFRTAVGGRVKYRILSDFFTDGRIPSCWRSSGKTFTKVGTPKVSINRTICIVSESETSSPVEPEPKSPDQDLQDNNDTIDMIINNMNVNDVPLTPIGEAPRSMFDFCAPSKDVVGRFVDRSESVMSAPSPTHARLDDQMLFDFDDYHAGGPMSDYHTSGPMSPTPPNNKNKKIPPSKGQNANRKMARRRSLQDNSLMSHRPTVSSPIIRRNSEKSFNRPSPTTSSLARDPLARVKPRTGKDCKSRKTSLPHITKNNNMVAADGCISI